MHSAVCVRVFVCVCVCVHCILVGPWSPPSNAHTSVSVTVWRKRIQDRWAMGFEGVERDQQQQQQQQRKAITCSLTGQGRCVYREGGRRATRYLQGTRPSGLKWRRGRDRGQEGRARSKPKRLRRGPGLAGASALVRSWQPGAKVPKVRYLEPRLLRLAGQGRAGERRHRGKEARKEPLSGEGTARNRTEQNTKIGCHFET
ncbi:hypothetical protein LY78DRAFT_659680 [Colletotrichum sublineola]|nr:hypothetical protein LY78DRAFT_659680 [Colletotrichum sublineola]